MAAPIFKCKLCGKEYTASEKDEPSATLLPQDIDKLRAAWLKADVADKGEDIRAAIRHDQAIKASVSYFGKCYNTGAWKLPNGLTTKRTGGEFGKFYFCCIEKCK